MAFANRLLGVDMEMIAMLNGLGYSDSAYGVGSQPPRTGAQWRAIARANTITSFGAAPGDGGTPWSTLILAAVVGAVGYRYASQSGVLPSSLGCGLAGLRRSRSRRSR